tara:strand:+ start:146 stop:592 length:447 start_codon:yes stop_codon:yes gene_type:complete
MPIKSFRGKIEADAVDTIALSTNNGSTGYKIKSLKVIGQQPSAVNQESTLKIFTIPKTVADVTSTIDFSDNTLIAVAFYETDHTATLSDNQNVIFDNITFNQDIFITMKGTASTSLNYYIELEQIKLSLDENTVATLKDIRNIEASTL